MNLRRINYYLALGASIVGCAYLMTSEMPRSSHIKNIVLIGVLVIVALISIHYDIKRRRMILKISQCKDIYELDQLCKDRNITEEELIEPRFNELVKSAFAEKYTEKEIAEWDEIYDIFADSEVAKNNPRLKIELHGHILEKIKGYLRESKYLDEKDERYWKIDGQIIDIAKKLGSSIYSALKS